MTIFDIVLFIILVMNKMNKEKIYACWRKCEHIAQSGIKEWRFDENGFPVQFCYYKKPERQGGWFVKEDEQHKLHICSYDALRTLL